MHENVNSINEEWFNILRGQLQEDDEDRAWALEERDDEFVFEEAFEFDDDDEPSSPYNMQKFPPKDLAFIQMRGLVHHLISRGSLHMILSSRTGLNTSQMMRGLFHHLMSRDSLQMILSSKTSLNLIRMIRSLVHHLTSRVSLQMVILSKTSLKFIQIMRSLVQHQMSRCSLQKT